MVNKQTLFNFSIHYLALQPSMKPSNIDEMITCCMRKIGKCCYVNQFLFLYR